MGDAVPHRARSENSDRVYGHERFFVSFVVQFDTDAAPDTISDMIAIARSTSSSVL
jgi:hypothetical protein